MEPWKTTLRRALVAELQTIPALRGRVYPFRIKTSASPHVVCQIVGDEHEPVQGKTEHRRVHFLVGMFVAGDLKGVVDQAERLEQEIITAATKMAHQLGVPIIHERTLPEEKTIGDRIYIMYGVHLTLTVSICRS